jgi:hypothetical protein
MSSKEVTAQLPGSPDKMPGNDLPGKDPAGNGLSSKGLKAGAVGLVGAVVIGVSCIAPAYTLTAALGPTVSEVGASCRRSSWWALSP